MEIKSIEKQEDIVTVKMTMPSCCNDCYFFWEDGEGYLPNHCNLTSVEKGIFENEIKNTMILPSKV